MFITEHQVPSKWDNSVSNYLNGEDTFTIVNISPDVIYAVEGNSTPDDSVIGIPVAPGNYIRYEKGDMSYLYLKNGFPPVAGGALSKTSRVSVNKVG